MGEAPASARLLQQFQRVSAALSCCLPMALAYTFNCDVDTRLYVSINLRHTMLNISFTKT